MEAFLRGELGSDECRRVRRHLAACDACAALLDVADRIELLPALADEMAPSADIHARFKERLLQHRERRDVTGRAWWRNWARPQQLALAGALTAVLFVAVYFGFYGKTVPQPAAAPADVAVAQHLPVLEEMEIISNLDMLENFEEIQTLAFEDPSRQR
jgi:anti-sigma factor RsiW